MESEDHFEVDAQPPGKTVQPRATIYDRLGALCFLLGSLLFTADGIGYCVEQLTWHGLLYTLGSALFAVGSGFMLL